MIRRTAGTDRPDDTTDCGHATTGVRAGPRSAPMRLLRTLGLAAGLAIQMLSVGVAHANEADISRAEELRQMVERGTRFEHAEGLQRDLAHAHALYCRAARENSPDALVRLGWMYANGRGVPRDDSTAHTLFRRAGTLGSELAQRLASVVKGPDERLPDCLIARAPAPEPDPKPLDIPLTDQY